MDDLFAIAGLGNPGNDYAMSRHNAGFRAVDYFTDDVSLSWKSKFNAHFARLTCLGNPALILIKPQTYMNRSGQAVSALLNFFDIPLERLIVISDDLDLAAGQLRISRGGSAAGHRGIEDLIEKLGGNDFFRVRIGIGRPIYDSERATSEEREQLIVNWVLGKPTQEEARLLNDTEKQAAEAVRCLIKDGLSMAQNRFNRHGVRSSKEQDL